MGAIYIDPAIKRATIKRDECVECYACFNGLSQEHLNPTLVRTIRGLLAKLRSDRGNVGAVGRRVTSC